jgi:hypothetical protein
MPPSADRTVITWESEPGKSYAIRHAPAVTDPWTTMPGLNAVGTATSWTDDGALTGFPPGSPFRPQSFYQVMQLQ